MIPSVIWHLSSNSFESKTSQPLMGTFPKLKTVDAQIGDEGSYSS